MTGEVAGGGGCNIYNNFHRIREWSLGDPTSQISYIMSNTIYMFTPALAASVQVR
jgi:hypothetical protein